MTFDFASFWSSLVSASQYIPITLLMSVVPLVVGFVFGTLIAVARRFHLPIIGQVADWLVPIFKGIPLVLHLFILNFVILKPLDLLSTRYEWAEQLRFMDKSIIVIAALSIFAIITISETMRSALMSVDDGQYEAGYSVGITWFQVLRRIALPQALPIAAPVLCNNFIGLIKGSSVAYLLAVMDIMNGAMAPAQINYRFLEAYVASAVIYWALCFTVERALWFFENHTGKFRNKQSTQRGGVL